MHEEAGTFTLLPGARGCHGLFGARADPVRYRAVRAVIGLHMRRHLRYLTTIFSVAFETQKVLAFFVSSQADLPTHPPPEATMARLERALPRCDTARWSLWWAWM